MFFLGRGGRVAGDEINQGIPRLFDHCPFSLEVTLRRLVCS